jgi:hypothetical protein
MDHAVEPAEAKHQQIWTSIWLVIVVVRIASSRDDWLGSIFCSRCEVGDRSCRYPEASMRIRTTSQIAALLSLALLLTTTPIAQAAESSKSAGAAVGEQIEVYRPDGSVQCEPGGAISLEQMRTTLTDAGIVVHSQRKADDGLMRPAVCGAGTGAINVYSIDTDQLDAAIAQGFRPLLH